MDVKHQLVLFSLILLLGSCSLTQEPLEEAGQAVSSLLPYEHWDLIIDSNDDLNKLTSADEVEYRYVLVLDGTYQLDGPLDLEAHDVLYFSGTDKHSVLFEVDYDFADQSIMRVDTRTSYLGNFAIRYVHETSPSSTEGVVIDAEDAADLEIEDVHIYGFQDSGSGISGTSGNRGVQSGETLLKDIHVDDCHIGFSNLMRLEDCTAYSCGSDGYENYIYLDTCFANLNDGDGFHECEIISDSRSGDNQGSGFYGGGDRLGRITGSYAVNNLYGFHRCQYIAASTASGNAADWFDCASVDEDSTDYVSVEP